MSWHGPPALASQDHDGVVLHGEPACGMRHDATRVLQLMPTGATAHLVRRLGHADEPLAIHGIEGKRATGQVDGDAAATRESLISSAIDPLFARAQAETFPCQKFLV